MSEQAGFTPEKFRLDLSGVKQLGMMNISELEKISEKDVNPKINKKIGSLNKRYGKDKYFSLK